MAIWPDFLATVCFNASVVSPLYSWKLRRQFASVEENAYSFVSSFLLDKTLFFGFLARVFIEQNVLLGFEVATTAVVYDIWYTV